MLYFNEGMGILKKVIPDFYEAITVRDFLKNKNIIETPSRWELLNPINFCVADLRGGPSKWDVLAYVTFHNVDLGFEGRGKYKISDLTGEFIAGSPISAGRIKFGTCADPKKLTEGRYVKMGVLYSPRNDWAYLEYAKKLGPAQKDVGREFLDDIVNATT